MLSGKAMDTIRACRFCWMCRHLCPVGLVTGREANTPRAKALLLDMEQKGRELMGEYAEDMFQCCLCGACASSCETGYEPPVFIREARRNIASGGLAPREISDVIGDHLKAGDAPGAAAVREVRSAGAAGTADTLFFRGARLSEKNREMADAFGEILEKAGVSYLMFEEEPADGNELFDLIGETAEVKRTAVRCAEAINGSGAERVVVLNPSSARMFRQEYPAWGLELSAEVVTATVFAAELLKSGKVKAERADMEGPVTFHDPCRLARDLDETEAARDIIAAMGCELREMIQSRKITKCCGGTVLASHSPRLAEQTASGRRADADRIGAGSILTACPGCLSVLRGGSGTAEVKDIFVFLNERIRCSE
ncbi:(Fe-S)-binding protein [Bacilliculturomica massiliensis]|uniref:(Fe-S)-binding protein n=1 Tax=Bacilliculturomica massiliensis TaxID=1917867 RepID=UPI0010300294|nr:(Fe-S)-binding protein [Bacilliculturomica massiliensis]